MNLPGGGELIVILLIVLLIFGGKKLPELASSMGRSIKEFRKASAPDDEDETDGEDRAASSATDTEA